MEFLNPLMTPTQNSCGIGAATLAAGVATGTIFFSDTWLFSAALTSVAFVVAACFEISDIAAALFTAGVATGKDFVSDVF